MIDDLKKWFVETLTSFARAAGRTLILIGVLALLMTAALKNVDMLRSILNL